MRVVLALAALAGARAAAPEDAVLRPGVPLFDTDGNRLYAGGANLFLDNGVYYLVGEGRKTLPDACSECLNLYSSTDLATWKFEACVLHNKDVVSNTPPNPVYRMERPKIFRCTFNAHNAAPARCARNCDPNDPNTQSYARPTTLNQQARQTTASRCGFTAT